MNYCPERFVAENVAAVFLTLKSCVMKSGGEGGIRTPDTVSRMLAFEASSFNHSDTSPPSIISQSLNAAKFFDETG